MSNLFAGEIVKMFAEGWLVKENITDRKAEKAILKFASEIDKMLVKAELEDIEDEKKS